MQEDWSLGEVLYLLIPALVVMVGMTAASVGDSDAVKLSHQSDIPQSSDLSRSSRQHSFMWLSFDSNVKCHWGPMTLLAYSKS